MNREVQRSHLVKGKLPQYKKQTKTLTKKKLKANIPMECKWNNSQQNISKEKPTTHKKDEMPS